jgi:3-oxoacyl-[acyl-carrier protein] reductase
MDLGLKNRVAIVAASSQGIGRATADIMASEGAVIVGVDNDERRLAMAMEAMNMSGGRAIGRPANALDQTQVDEVVAWAAKQYGTVDILVNAVGGFRSGSVADSEPDEFRFVHDLNVATAWWS